MITKGIQLILNAKNGYLSQEMFGNQAHVATSNPRGQPIQQRNSWHHFQCNESSVKKPIISNFVETIIYLKLID